MYILSRKNSGPCLLLVLISFCTLFFRIGTLPFIGADEPRYARIAEEMSEQGRWVTPILEGRPWLEKPPLYYWITIPFYRLSGVSETTARMGPALLTLMSGFFIFWLGSRLWDRAAGLSAAVIFLTSLGVAAYGRSGSTDMPLTACFTAGLSLLGAALFEDLSRWKVRCGYVLLGLSILGKGPVALLLWAGIGISFWVLDERGEIIRRWRVLEGIAIMTAVALPWFWLAFRENGFGFIAVFIVNHNIARYVTDIHHHSQPVYYYLPILPGLLFPWTAWMLLAWPRPILKTLRNWRAWDRKTMLLSCWALFPLVFFSFSNSKLPGYILPTIPPLALLAGRRIAEVLAAAGSTAPAGPAVPLRPVVWTHAAISTVLAAAFPIVFFRSYGGTWTMALPVMAACLLPALAGLACVMRGKVSGAVKATAAQGVLLVIVLALVAFPLIGRYQSAREIARLAVSLRQGSESIVTYNYFHHALNYYSGYRVGEDLPDPVALGQFAQSQARLLIVTEASHVEEVKTLEQRGCSVTVLGEQGRLRLMRVQCPR